MSINGVSGAYATNVYQNCANYNESAKEKPKEKLTDEQKNNLKTAGVVLGGLAALGTVIWAVKSGKAKQAIESIKTYTTKTNIKQELAKAVKENTQQLEKPIAEAVQTLDKAAGKTITNKEAAKQVYNGISRIASAGDNLQAMKSAAGAIRQEAINASVKEANNVLSKAAQSTGYKVLDNALANKAPSVSEHLAKLAQEVQKNKNSGLILLA